MKPAENLPGPCHHPFTPRMVAQRIRKKVILKFFGQCFYRCRPNGYKSGRYCNKNQNSFVILALYKRLQKFIFAPVFLGSNIRFVSRISHALQPLQSQSESSHAHVTSRAYDKSQIKGSEVRLPVSFQKGRSEIRFVLSNFNVHAKFKDLFKILPFVVKSSFSNDPVIISEI